MFMRCLFIALICCWISPLDGAVKKFGITFKSMRDLKPFTCIGGRLKLDVKNSTQKSSGSLTLEPGTRIELPLFKKKDGTGNISVMFYDDMTGPDDVTKHRRGPSFGLRNKEGYELSIGILYAPFTDGANYYYINHYRHTDKGQTAFSWVKHIRVKRSKGWNAFAFECDPRKGLIIKHNGQDINHKIADKKFDYKEIKFASFDKLVFHGDKNDDKAQTVYIDNIVGTLNPEGTALKLPE